MKDFIKMLLAVICGIVITFLVMFFVCMGFVGTIGALASKSASPLPKADGVLVLDMSKFALGEQSEESNPLASLSGQESVETIGIRDATKAIEMAADDPVIKYIYLCTDGSLSDISASEELRSSLEGFRERSGKPVIAYMESPSTMGIYLSSAADKVYLSSHLGATPTVVGVGTQMIFLGDLLNKLGVNVQLIRHGKYKSAGEMFTRSSASAENREQYQRLVNSLWETISADIAEEREVSLESLNEAVDGLKLNLPQDFVDCGLVDELLTREELENKLAVLAVKDDIKDVAMVSFSDYVAAKILPESFSKSQIAIIYANGDIVDGSGKADVAGDRFASLISKVRSDSTIKAVVLRVNSPGGSVMASEKIKHELDLLKEDKPLVASYGSYAASGGYWISNNCDKIFTDKTTITGSIGVFGVVPDFSKTANDVLHINIETVNSNKHSDMFSGMKAFDNEEYNFMLRSIESIYDKFTTTVAEGRSMPKETVDAIGQGRVWTGADAVSINLTDEVGTLEDAVLYAASVAGIPDNYSITEYPKPRSQMDNILSLLGGDEDENEVKALAKWLRSDSKAKVLARMDNEIRIK